MASEKINYACPLCSSLETDFFSVSYNRPFNSCQICGLIFIQPEYLLKDSEANERYRHHENALEDQAYLKWCSVFLDQFKSLIKPADTVLDYGAGPVKAFAHLLPSHNVESYDPLFFSDEMILQKKYDVIICQEVVEHFVEVKVEWTKMLSLLKPQGQIFIRTSLFNKSLDFSKWHYPRDLTHVSIYQQKSVEWIQENMQVGSRLRFKC
jgi:hypothetical protein